MRSREENSTLINEEPVINEAADRALGRIILRYGTVTLVLLLVVPFLMVNINLPTSQYFGDRRFFDTLSTLIVLAPFFAGTNKIFSTRLNLGRSLAGERKWDQVIASVEPFEKPTQRFMDRTGEAHYLLFVAYTELGRTDDAAEAKKFLTTHRHGEFALQAEQWKHTPSNDTTINRGSRKHTRRATKNDGNGTTAN